MDTGETPAALERRPQFKLAAHAMIFQCFMMLHMMRTSNGFGPNPITIGMVNEYEARFGRMPIDDDLLIRLLKRCDEAALEWIRNKMAPKDKS